VGEHPLEFRTIGELAALVGHYGWVEHRLFELTGTWATAPDDGTAAEVRVWSAAASRRHGELATRWAGHLPVRAGVDPTALMVPPAGPLAGVLDAVEAEPDTAARLGVLVSAVLPRVVDAYETHLATASPVSEAPVMERLGEALREGEADIRGGRSLLLGLPGGGDRAGALTAEVERAFGPKTVFPAERAS
jgi:hypothetical protein